MERGAWIETQSTPWKLAREVSERARTRADHGSCWARAGVERRETDAKVEAITRQECDIHRRIRDNCGPAASDFQRSVVRDHRALSHPSVEDQARTPHGEKLLARKNPERDPNPPAGDRPSTSAMTSGCKSRTGSG